MHLLCLRGSTSRIIYGIVAILTTLGVNRVFAQDALVLSRLSGPIILDGRVDEAAWLAIEPVPLIQYQPVFEGEMTERTEIRIGYDDTYLWVSGRMYESDPSKIQGNTLTRDASSSDDIFAIVLDTFGDNENALWFSTTPRGVRIDRSVSGDAESTGGGRESIMNSSWNTFWDTATTITEDGWFAEMRIPYSSLGFQDVNGRVEMGMIVYRYMAKNSERHIYPPIRPEYGMGFAKPSLAQTVVLENVRSGHPIYITPYISGGALQEAELNTDRSGYHLTEEWSGDIGGDLKYSVNDNLTLDLTVNTDFAQVEADEQQVNLTRFSLFFPEKRQFFQERAGIFNFATGSVDRVFHSRQIGISDSGLVSIYGGGRIVGRVGSWDIGAINMQTQKSEILPSENFGVLRLRRRVINQTSNVGTLLTSRIGNDNTYNLVYALDASLNIQKTDYVTTKWVQTFADTPYESENFEFKKSVLAYAQYERRGTVGFGFSTGLRYVGKDYNPGVGFVQRRDIWTALGELRHGWLYDGSSTIRTLETETSLHAYVRNGNGTLESLLGEHEWKADLTTGASAEGKISVAVEDLTEELELPGDTYVPIGRYTFSFAEIQYNFPFGSILRGRYSVTGGQFYDGWRTQVNFSPTWSVSKHLEFEGRYLYSYLRFPDRHQSESVHLIGLTTKVGFTTKFSVSALGQYNTDAALFSSNVRIRYNFREGNDLWIVFNQNMNTDRMRGMPELSVIENRNVQLKYTYTFTK